MLVSLLPIKHNDINLDKIKELLFNDEVLRMMLHCTIVLIIRLIHKLPNAINDTRVVKIN